MEQIQEKPSVSLRRLIDGYQVTQAIHVAATLGIADLLQAGPRSSDDLAATTTTHPRTLYRLLRALASVGVVHEVADRHFALTPLGACLCSDAPEPLGPWAAFVGRPYEFNAWGHLLHSVQTGENATRHVHGMSGWDYRERHPEEGAIFDRAMTGNSRVLAPAALNAYDFGRYETIVDVGGGQGAFLAAILAKHPAVHGILFDEQHVVAGAESVLQAAGVRDRCQIIAGDFFDSVPPGGDAYVLKVVIHDWEDAEAVAILRSCRQAIGEGGTLVVVERVVDRPNEDAPTKFADLNMLVGPGGQERTQEEFSALFAAGGFRLSRVIPTDSVLRVIEGVPA